MMRFIAAVIATLAVAPAPAHADTFTYACKDRGKSSIVKIDTAKNTLKWAGKTYSIKDAKEGDCLRFGWSVSGNDKSFDFCTATQGVADFAIDGHDIECDQRH